MKKLDAYENGAAKAAKVNLIIAIGLGLLVAVVVGFNLGTPSAKDREKVAVIERQYKDLSEAVARASATPKEDWHCTQGKVEVQLQAVDVPITTSSWARMGSDGAMYESIYGTNRTIKTVSERTTMDCTRQVKQYSE